MKKLYIIAGEASGDLHGSNVIKAMKRQDPTVQIQCWGGDKMQAAGGELRKHYRDLAFMGFVEVVMNLKTIMRNISFCKKDIEDFAPDALLLIDYPGFNMRIAKWAHEKGIKVFYYISPTIWAWKENRVYSIKRDCERMFCILPFEKAFYKKFDYEADFVGHPLLDEITTTAGDDFNTFARKHELSAKPMIAVLPGSRKQEIATKLPKMLALQKDFPEYQFVIAGAPGQTKEYYQQFISNNTAPVLFGATYDILRLSTAGLVTSGTATLEAGLFRLPQVVCYQANSISYAIAKRLVKIKYISLVNLILNRESVRELIQGDLTYENMKHELSLLLHDDARIAKMKADYDELHGLLGGPGASEKVATAVLKSL